MILPSDRRLEESCGYRRAYLTIAPTGHIRLDEIKVNNSQLIKITEFGWSNGDIACMTDTVKAVSSFDHGLLHISGVTVRSENDRPWTESLKSVSGMISDGAELRYRRMYDNSSFVWYDEVFEKDINLPFVDVLGMISTIVSGFSMLLPFSMILILDTEDGVNVRDAKLTYKSLGIDIDLGKIFMSAINLFMRHLMSMGVKNTRIYITIGDFGSGIMIVEKIHGRSFTIRLNNSDHGNVIRSMYVALGPSYPSTEEFHTLRSTGIPTVFPCMIDEMEMRDFISPGRLTQFITEYS